MKDNTQATWTVDSMDRVRRSQGVTYKVSRNKQGHYHCTCEAFRFGEGEECKHIEYVRDEQPVPDQEVMTRDQLGTILSQALQGRKNVVVRVNGNTISISDQ